MPYKNSSGAYAIIHIESQRVYVGSATNIQRRWNHHREHLRKGSHTNKYLQNAWHKYGESSFEWRILETTQDTSRLFELEQKWIEHFKSSDREKGFNIAPRAGTTLGIKMDAAFRARCSEIHTGRKRPQKTKDAISAALKGNQNGKGKYYCGHLTEPDVSKILYQVADGILFNDIASQFGVSGSTVARIAKRRIWKHVTLPPEIEERIPKSFAHRRAIGSRNSKTKLTPEKVMEIRQCLLSPYRGILKDLANRFCVAPQSIRDIQRRKNWKHVS